MSLDVAVRISREEAAELAAFLARLEMRNISDEDRRTVYWLQNALSRARNVAGEPQA